MEIKLYNTLTREKEVFRPIKKGRVGMYSCGPTVYWYQHIGNFRTMLLSDLLKRVFIYNNYFVNHVMNITDVDDKTIKGSKREGLLLHELTGKYEGIFFSDLESLGILKPKYILRATENIDEMVNLVKKLLKKNCAYTTSDGIYFDIKKFRNYGKLAGLHKFKITKERIRNDEYDKSGVRDFVLWKFWTPEDGAVFWDTEIGKGRPGWHVECSAMSMKVLGESFDVHVGGMDLIFPHHTNEIAQSEAATGKKFVNYWIHGGMLNLKEGKMSKSLRNIYTIHDLLEHGFEPVHYRYLSYQTHYRKPLNFSLEAMDAAKNGFNKMKMKILELKKEKHHGRDFSEKYENEFSKAVNDDLNMPRALQTVWDMLGNFNFDAMKKLKLLEKFDDILALNIKDMHEAETNISSYILELLDKRENLRRQKKWGEADKIREKIREKGFEVEDGAEGAKLKKI